MVDVGLWFSLRREWCSTVVDPVAELLERPSPFTGSIWRAVALELAWSVSVWNPDKRLEDGVRREHLQCARLLEGVLFPRED
jgi:hypothetical protein